MLRWVSKKPWNDWFALFISEGDRKAVSTSTVEKDGLSERRVEQMLGEDYQSHITTRQTIAREKQKHRYIHLVMTIECNFCVLFNHLQLQLATTQKGMSRMVNYDQKSNPGEWRMQSYSKTFGVCSCPLLFLLFFPKEKKKRYPARNFLMGLQEVERGRGLVCGL